MLVEEAAAPNQMNALFGALDQLVIEGADGAWTVEVLGIHRHAGRWWVQIAPPRGTGAGVLLHGSRDSTIQDAIAALTRWRAFGNESAAVVPC